jgi:hypothetical protein
MQFTYNYCCYVESDKQYTRQTLSFSDTPSGIHYQDWKKRLFPTLTPSLLVAPAYKK